MTPVSGLLFIFVKISCIKYTTSAVFALEARLPFYVFRCLPM